MNRNQPSQAPEGDPSWSGPTLGNIAFIGGGNMAGALIGGLLRLGLPRSQIMVVEPLAQAREQLAARWQIQAQASSTAQLQGCDLVVWAIKPQIFGEAAAQTAPHTRDCLHLSVAAGIDSDSIARWVGSERVVRCMPNTPALIGQGISGLFARPAVSASDRQLAQRVLESSGQTFWVEHEPMLDAVTALSGSGPAYVFYFIEAMMEAASEMGFDPAQARQLAIATFVGSAALAQASDEHPAVLRQRVTSRGGTTQAAIESLDADLVKTALVRAMQAARSRAAQMGREMGASS